ncbi:unnamed protein product [Heterosigma akashiwo]
MSQEERPGAAAPVQGGPHRADRPAAEPGPEHRGAPVPVPRLGRRKGGGGREGA